MPLIDLKTDLKSLKYGKDTPGGGYSGQPYIQAKIPDGLEPKSLDFILRGGYLTVGDSLTDIKRLGKMFGDLKSPNGVLFIAKQNVLSNSAVRTQAGGTLNNGVYTPLSTLAQAGLVAFGGHLNKQGTDPTGLSSLSLRTYSDVVNPTLGAAFSLKSTNNNRLVRLASEKIKGNYVGNVGISLVDNSISILSNNLLTYRGGPGSVLGVGFTNIGFADQRTGLNNPLLETDPDYFYGRNTKQFIPGNYLKALGIEGGFNDKGVSGKFLRLTNARLINNFNPDGQPLGDYFHNVYEPAVEGNTWPTNTPLINANNTFTYNQEDIIQSNVNPPSGNHLSPQIQDFRAALRDKALSNPQSGQIEYNLSKQAGQLSTSLPYSGPGAQNFEQRVHIGNPGQRGNNDYSDYAKGVLTKQNSNSGSAYAPFGTTPGGLDRINSLPIYRSENVDTTLPVNDFVKFRIAVIDNDSPTFKTFMHFRAFLGPISDSYNADWNGFNYLGRGEKFYTYSGFDRKISLSWTVAAQSKEELIPMYKKLNYLASTLAPDYSPNGYMRGNLVQLTIGGYLYEQPGFITNLTYEMGEDSPWELGIGTTETPDDPSVKELTQIIRVTGFSFTPIHNFVPRKQQLTFTNKGTPDSVSDDTGFVQNYDIQRFIALANGPNANQNNYDS
jgi:hypothetical protein